MVQTLRGERPKPFQGREFKEFLGELDESSAFVADLAEMLLGFGMLPYSQKALAARALPKMKAAYDKGDLNVSEIRAQWRDPSKREDLLRKYAGMKEGPGGKSEPPQEAASGQNYYNNSFKSESNAKAKAGPTVSFVKEKSEIQLRFPEDKKPDRETLNQLHAQKFRFSRPQKLWYAKDAPERREFAEGLTGLVEKTSPVPKIQTRTEEPMVSPKSDAPVALRYYNGNLEVKASDAASDRRKMILERAVSEGKRVPPEALKNYPELAIKHGENRLNEVIEEQADRPYAMYRDDLGRISFIWGEPGKEANNFKKGYGVSHILARRGLEGQDGKAIALKMVEVIVKGKAGEIYGPRGGERVNINYGKHTAVLSLYKDGQRESWLLTGWKEKTSDEPGEGYGSSGPTHAGPMRTRPDMGAEVKNKHIKKTD